MSGGVLITGGTGFIARSLMPLFLSEGRKVYATVRDERGVRLLPKGVAGVLTGELDVTINWQLFLENIETVVHLAARVHQVECNQAEMEEVYQRINVRVTEALANASSRAGVRRLVFISSVKVMGESTAPGQAWDESAPCCPQDAYGRSKRDAERILIDIAKKTNLETVILRIPLVYGPGVKANMSRLFRTVDRRVPLPFGAIRNRRSLLYVGNLVDAIRTSLEHPAAAGETFLVSDGKDPSMPELIRSIACALGRPARLFHFPSSGLHLAGRVLGKSAEVGRLLNSLVIDIGKIRRILSWEPPYTMEHGLKQTANWYQRNEHTKTV